MQVGVAGCAFNTSVSGVYRIQFSVTDNANQTSLITRNLTVNAVCPVGEILCSNGLECSVLGVCLSDLQNGLAAQTEEMDPLEDDFELDFPPAVDLVVTGVIGRVVDVKQYHPYEACATGKVGVLHGALSKLAYGNVCG